jgi:uncharacterized membrane protein YczE
MEFWHPIALIAGTVLAAFVVGFIVITWANKRMDDEEET